MGVCGSGKSTAAEKLSKLIGAKFIDADYYHSPENKQKMANGFGFTLHYFFYCFKQRIS